MVELKEECGVFGIITPDTADIASSVYYGLFALQHRGQESCGIVVNNNGVFSSYLDNGLVGDVYTPDILDALGCGNIAVGHVRYATSANGERRNAQPIIVDHIKGHLAIAHNGALTNYGELREGLELGGAIFHTSSDAEVIAYLIIRERLTASSIEEAVCRAMSILEGAYSLIIVSPTKLIAARDSHGFRPLCFGITEDGAYVAASETCALDAANAKLIRDVAPGEICVFDSSGPRFITEHCGKVKPSFCVFELIYFARPDSVISGCSVNSVRQRAGGFLAQDSPVGADVVIGVPDSGIDAAIGYSRRSGIPYGVGLIKNKYIGRTFISPGRQVREDKVRLKLNAVSATVCGKRVVLVDDSIVRGTTSASIVHLLRDAGAAEVHMRVSAPPFLNPCYYGTDISSREDLIAHRHSLAEIEKLLGVDSLGYLKPQRITELSEQISCNGLCTACFDNNYPTPIPAQPYINRYGQPISERSR